MLCYAVCTPVDVIIVTAAGTADDRQALGKAIFGI